jgi:hypothetical protein
LSGDEVVALPADLQQETKEGGHWSPSLVSWLFTDAR